MSDAVKVSIEYEMNDEHETLPTGRTYEASGTVTYDGGGPTYPATGHEVEIHGISLDGKLLDARDYESHGFDNDTLDAARDQMIAHFDHLGDDNREHDD